MSRIRDTIDRHPRGVKIGIIFVVVLLIPLLVLGGLYVFGAYLFYDSYETTYNYELELSVDGQTEEIVIIAPAPVHNNSVTLGELSLWTSENRVDDWESDIIETDHGPMLRISISGVTGPDQLMFTSTVYSNRTIETKAPRGVEPVLSPLYDIEERDSSFERRPDTRLYDSTSMMYAEHSGSDALTLDVVIRHEGANTWWTFGWSGNYYETYLTSFGVTPDSAGEWWEIRGDHREGVGSYARFGPPLPR